jgi:hypothetical protein
LNDRDLIVPGSGEVVLARALRAREIRNFTFRLARAAVLGDGAQLVQARSFQLMLRARELRNFSITLVRAAALGDERAAR